MRTCCSIFKETTHTYDMWGYKTLCQVVNSSKEIMIPVAPLLPTPSRPSASFPRVGDKAISLIYKSIPCQFDTTYKTTEPLCLVRCRSLR